METMDTNSLRKNTIKRFIKLFLLFCIIIFGFLTEIAILFVDFEFFLEKCILIFAIISVIGSFLISFFNTRISKKDKEILKEHEEKIKNRIEKMEREALKKIKKSSKMPEFEKEMLELDERYEILKALCSIEIKDEDTKVVIISRIDDSYHSSEKRCTLEKKYIPLIVKVLRDEKFYSDWEVELEKKIDNGVFRFFFKDYDRGRQEITIYADLPESKGIICFSGSQIFINSFIKTIIPYASKDEITPLPDELTLEEYFEKIRQQLVMKYSQK